MSALNARQQQALQLIVVMTLEAIAAADPAGAPSGVLYAGLMTQGCTLNQFNSLMAALVKSGRVRQAGLLYFIEGVAS